MDGIALQKTLTHQLQQIARTCLRLELEPGEHSRTEPESGFGGCPSWPVGESWPRCDGCGKLLTFVCQLRLDGGGHWRPGAYDLCSVFFCAECSQQDDVALAERPSGDGCRLRLLHLADQPLASLELPADLHVPARVASRRVRSVPLLDVPNWQDVADELAEVAPGALDDLHAWYRLAESDLLRGHDEAAQSQLGGYPHWASASYWPECRWCGGQMYLLAQFIGGHHVALPWGDGRRAYLFCCAEPCDPEALTLILQG
jgi:hypothetical protein